MGNQRVEKKSGRIIDVNFSSSLPNILLLGLSIERGYVSMYLSKIHVEGIPGVGAAPPEPEAEIR